MFNFIKEITDLAGLNEEKILLGYKYVNLLGEAVYVQGYKDVLNITSEEIILKLKDGELKIEGEDLNIRDLNAGSITINGKIKSITEV